MRRRFSPSLSVLLACGAVLALVACSSGGGGVGQGELDAERARAAAAEKTLDGLRASLRRAQEALTSGGTGAEQRAQARIAVSAARQDLREARRTLAAQPDDAAKTAAGEALAAADTALERVDEALADADAARLGSGPIVLAAMHTTLDRAQAALDDAQAKMNAALAANPSGTLRTLLAQTQATLAAAQVSLVPLLREELTTAERDAAAQRARADAATARGDTEKARAEAEKARADAEKARADAAGAEVDRLTLSFGKDLKIGGPEASRVAPADDSAVALSPRRAGVMLTAAEGFDPTGAWRDATKYAVADYGTANPDRLPIAQDPVAWREGAGMVIPGASGSPATNEFPGRGQVFRTEAYDHPEFLLARQGSYGPAADGTAATAVSRLPSGTGLRANLRGHPVWSFQYRDEGGLTMKFGSLPPDRKPDGAPDESMGSLIFGDLERLAAKGTYDCGADGDMACDETVTGDLAVSFGAPSRDPAGDPNYYWTVDVPNPKLALDIGETNDVDEANRAAPDDDIGRYEMLLSNHAGDGEDIYLRYAAYGLFQFIDYQTETPRPGRTQTFHYGFDAFGDHNPLPAPTADSIAATWKGRTAAWLATTRTGARVSGFVAGLDRMRGNVTLHACIGGGGCRADAFVAPAGAAKPADANDIVGAVHDLEIVLPGGAWGRADTAGHPAGYSAFGGDVLLDGAIDANGAFSGTATPDPALYDSRRSVGDSGRSAGPDTHGYTLRPQIGGIARSMSDYWRNGRFEGAFYGPREALEAAGTWWLPASATALNDNGVLGIVGSFGAVVASD